MVVIYAIRAFFRVLFKLIIGLIMRIFHILGEIVTLGLVPRRIRVRVVILRDAAGQPLVSEADARASLARTVQIFKDRFNINVRTFRGADIETLAEPAPAAALDVESDAPAFGEEFGEAGAYFAANTAGWFGIPTSLTFPLTVFVVRKVGTKIGCSIPITDYVTLSATSPGGGVSGVSDSTTMAHELAHSCLLPHTDDSTYLLYPFAGRGTDTSWLQRRVARTSRHATFW